LSSNNNLAINDYMHVLVINTNQLQRRVESELKISEGVPLKSRMGLQIGNFQKFAD